MEGGEQRVGLAVGIRPALFELVDELVEPLLELGLVLVVELQPEPGDVEIVVVEPLDLLQERLDQHRDPSGIEVRHDSPVAR